MSLNKYIPQTPEPLQLVQAKVPSKLRAEVKKILKSRGLTWNELIIAAMRQLLDEELQREE